MKTFTLILKILGGLPNLGRLKPSPHSLHSRRYLSVRSDNSSHCCRWRNRSSRAYVPYTESTHGVPTVKFPSVSRLCESALVDSFHSKYSTHLARHPCIVWTEHIQPRLACQTLPRYRLKEGSPTSDLHDSPLTYALRALSNSHLPEIPPT